MFSLRKFLVVLLSLGAFVAFAACSGSDGSDGKNGKSSYIDVTAATADQCVAGGNVYTTYDGDGNITDIQVVCNGESGSGFDNGTTAVWTTDNYGATTNESCVYCHDAYAQKFMDPTPITNKIIGTSAADTTARAGYTGGVHYASQYSNFSGNTTTSCASCHYKSRYDNMALYNLYGKGNEMKIGVASCVECHNVNGGHYGRTTVTVKSGNNTFTNDNMTATWGSCTFCHQAGVNPASNNHNPPHGNRYFTSNAGLAYADGNHGRGIAYVVDAANNGNILSDGANHYTVCAFCHTYNYAWKYNPMSGAKVDAEIEQIYHEKAEQFDADGHPQLLKGMASTGVGCATCHDAHTGDLNSKTTALKTMSSGKDSYDKSIVYVTGNQTLTAINADNITKAQKKFTKNTTTALTVYSEEFQLCTSCHPAKLKYEWIQDPTDATLPAVLVSPDGIGEGRLFPVNKFKYYLDDSVYNYASGDSVADMDAGHHYWSPRESVAGAGIGMSYNGIFATRHFGTKGGLTVPTHKTAAGVVDNVMVPTGFNIDAASPKPCTACHDPHNTSRFAPTTTLTQANLDGITSTYATSPHGAYDELGWDRASYGGGKGCMPCHNGREAVKFMERGTTAWGSNPYTGMQAQLVNGQGGVVTGCGSCHALDDTTTVDLNAVTGLPNTVAITGKMRVDITNNDNKTVDSNGVANKRFTLAAGGGEGRADTLNATVQAKQQKDQMLVCFTCHGGRTSLAWKATYSSTKQQTYCDNSSGVNTEYAHYAPGAGVVAGILLPKVKGVTLAEGIVARAANGTAGVAHVQDDGTFYSCDTCHDMNKNSHTFSVFKDASGNPVTHVVNKYDYTDTAKFNQVKGMMSCTQTCHGNYANSMEPIFNGFAGAMEFFEQALMIGIDNGSVTAKDGSTVWKAIRYYGSGGTIWKVWDQDNITGGVKAVREGVWANDNAANYALLKDNTTYGPVHYWQGLDGLKLYVVAETFETLHYDYGAYAHAEGIVKDAIGESLATLFQLGGGTTGTDFNTWLDGGTGITVDGGDVDPMAASVKTWLCGAAGCATAFDGWKQQ